MAHFSLESDINSLLRMDAPLPKAPLARWQRKAMEAPAITSANNSLNQSTNNLSIVKTPKHGPGSSDSSLCTAKTPKKTPGKSKTPKTPAGGDRFIPNRSTTQFGLGHFMVAQDASQPDESNENVSPHSKEQQKIKSNVLHGQDISTARIISYNPKAPSAPEGFQSSLQVVYYHSKTPSSSIKKTRYIAQAPDRILDAPEIMDDYYLNLVDWSCQNILAVALRGFVYLWNASTGDISKLVEINSMDGNDEYVSSVAWIVNGNILAVGTSSGTVQLWDISINKKIRTMAGHSARVGSMSWNEHILSSGSRTGAVVHHDVRRADHAVATLSGHTQEVCGLRWSPDGKYLASGGNDNLLHIWSAALYERFSEPNPLHTFTQHQSAVKALAWCPWHPGILASGGGTVDRCIRLWNCNTGLCLNTTDTRSQVCAILWSSEYRELISGHGFANNQLIIWKYPSMAKVAELTGHKARVLHMAMSPDGSTVVSAAADESLRLWKCFSVDPKKAKGAGKTDKGCPGAIITRQRIR